MITCGLAYLWAFIWNPQSILLVLLRFLADFLRALKDGSPNHLLPAALPPCPPVTLETGALFSHFSATLLPFGAFSWWFCCLNGNTGLKCYLVSSAQEMSHVEKIWVLGKSFVLAWVIELLAVSLMLMNQLCIKEDVFHTHKARLTRGVWEANLVFSLQAVVRCQWLGVGGDVTDHHHPSVRQEDHRGSRSTTPPLHHRQWGGRGAVGRQSGKRWWGDTWEESKGTKLSQERGEHLQV